MPLDNVSVRGMAWDVEEVEEKERKQAEDYLISAGSAHCHVSPFQVASFGQAAINGKFSAVSLTQIRKKDTARVAYALFVCASTAIATP